MLLALFLWFLYLLHIYWFFKLMKIVFKAIFKNQMSDDHESMNVSKVKNLEKIRKMKLN